jgi:6-pyruvoyltetrahydropterin/6-carboxytetrahydropterin synthase
MYRLQVKRHFDAAHQLTSYPGKCNGVHGHRWDVEVCVQGELDPWRPNLPPGLGDRMLIDFGDVKKELDSLLDWPNGLDHSFINEKLGEPNPTAEFLAKWFFDRLSEKLPGVVRVCVWESPDSCVKYSPGQMNPTNEFQSSWPGKVILE